MDDECTGQGKCHGCLSWCSICGDVAHVCDGRLRGERCDAHPVPPTWPELRAERSAAEKLIADGEAMVREGRRELERVVDRERARRAFAAQEAAEEARFWGSIGGGGANGGDVGQDTRQLSIFNTQGQT